MDKSEQVRLYPSEDHKRYLQGQLLLLNQSEVYLDTRLVCRDGSIQTSSLLAGLGFPELYSCPAFLSPQSSNTVILPETELSYAKERINLLRYLNGTGVSSQEGEPSVKEEDLAPSSFDEDEDEDLEDDEPSYFSIEYDVYKYFTAPDSNHRYSCLYCDEVLETQGQFVYFKLHNHIAFYHYADDEDIDRYRKNRFSKERKKKVKRKRVKPPKPGSSLEFKIILL